MLINIKKTTVFALAAVLSITAACGNGSFKKTATGLEYRSTKTGQGDDIKEGEFLFLNLCYKTSKGEILMQSSDREFPTVIKATKDSPKDGGIMEAIGMLTKKGDVILVKLNSKKAFNEDFSEKTDILVEIALEKVMTEEEFTKWQTEQTIIQQQKLKEKETMQLEKDIADICKYLGEKKISAQKTDSGLYYAITEAGKGSNPQPGETVKVNYTGYLLDGTVFDTSVEKVAKENDSYNASRTYAPLEFPVGIGAVIRGWDEGVLLLNEGAKARFFIPSTLAYGNRKMGNKIPANSILIFDVELVKIVPNTPKGKK